MNVISKFNEKKESKIDSYNDSALLTALAKVLEKYECHTIKVLCDNQVSSISEEAENITIVNFSAKSMTGQEIEIITKFIERGEWVFSNFEYGYIPLINFRRTSNNLKRYIEEVNFFPPKNTMTVEIFKIIYQKFKLGISQFTIPSNDSLVTIPIMLDGEQIDITITVFL